MPNSLARCKLVAHFLWFFSKSWLRCSAAQYSRSFFFFATLVSLSLFFCSWFLLYARFIPHSPCSALCFSCRLLIVMLLYMCFSAEFFCCARLFFSSLFSLSVFLLLYSVHALFSLYYSCFFASYFYLVFCVVSCALRAMFLSKLCCNLVSYITVL